MRYFINISLPDVGISVQMDVNSKCTEDLEITITHDYDTLVLAQALGIIDPYKVLNGTLPCTYLRYYGSTPTNNSVLQDVYMDCTDIDMLYIATGFPVKLRDEIFKDKDKPSELEPVIYNFTNVGARQ